MVVTGIDSASGGRMFSSPMASTVVEQMSDTYCWSCSFMLSGFVGSMPSTLILARNPWQQLLLPPKA